MIFSHFVLILTIAFSGAAGKISKHELSQLALKVSRGSYYGMAFLACIHKDRPEQDAGLCYKPCSQVVDSSWAFTKGIGPVCWGCPSSHPSEEVALCYRRCPSDKPDRGAFMCYGNCPSGYRNDGLTCFRDAHIFGADNSRCPWYDLCGLTFARGCSRCTSGYHNDGCTCRRDPHLLWRPSYNRGVGVVMKTAGRGVGVPLGWRYPSLPKLDCSVQGWVGIQHENKLMEMVMYTHAQQKLVAFGFRGTDAHVIDWFANIDFHFNNFWLKGTKLTTHGGFKKRYDLVAGWFEKRYQDVPSDYTILITGHSQGAAQATIAAVFAAAKLGRPPDAVILWGSPLTGSENFQRFYKREVGCDVTLDYANNGDTVTSMPNVYGYRHVCGVNRLGSKANPVKIAHNLWGDGGYGDEWAKKYKNSPKFKLGCDVRYNT